MSGEHPEYPGYLVVSACPLVHLGKYGKFGRGQTVCGRTNDFMVSTLVSRSRVPTCLRCIGER